jgi:hypothetical protein
MVAEHQDSAGAEERPEGAPRGGSIYVRIPEGMTNQIFRNGIIPDKKSIDSSYSTGVRGAANYRRE